MKFNKPHYKICFPLWLTTFALLVIGLMFVYSASVGHSRNYMPRQMMWVIIGLFLAFSLALIRLQEYKSYAAIVFSLAVASLLLVLIIGKERNGAKSWLGFGGLGIQPSEFAKIAVILIFGRFLADFEEHRYDLRYYLVSFILLIIPLALIFLQPDLGTALIFVPVILAMFFISGTNLPIIATTFIGGLATIPLMIPFLGHWRIERIKLTWFPERDPYHFGYQAVQSKIAIGSGLLTGRGFLKSLQSKLNFLPERHTDFIFSVIGEEWGFVGGIVVISLFFSLIIIALYISRHSKNVFGQVVAAGIAIMFATQVLMNVGMAVSLMPIIGVPLPMISYGGSSMLTALMSVGILQSIYNDSTI